MPEFTYENQDDDDLGDRGMVPLQALELAVDGGWEMREFVEKLRGEHGQESQEIAQMWLGTGGFLLTPEFWMCLGRALWWTGTRMLALDGQSGRYRRPLYEGVRWAAIALTSKPEERLKQQEAFWTEVLASRLSA
jgi:hypothetical protein